MDKRPLRIGERFPEAGSAHTQSIQDPVAIDTVNALEELSTNLARKIWQKIMIIDSALPVLQAREIAGQ